MLYLEGQEFEQEWLNSWVKGMRGIHEDLVAEQEAGRLVIPSWHNAKERKVPLTAEEERWTIYDSYIHMINNRLGILNRDEGYLGYLVKESFKHYKPSG